MLWATGASSVDLPWNHLWGFCVLLEERDEDTPILRVEVAVTPRVRARLVALT
jgi:hypothetical protein